MTAFILVGFVALSSGVMFLIAPGALVKLSSLLNQIVSTDHKTLKYRISVGVILTTVGLFFLFMAYYIYNHWGM
ncbi:MAG: hypothetical protein V1789_06085 [PVC group bacterium]